MTMLQRAASEASAASSSQTPQAVASRSARTSNMFSFGSSSQEWGQQSSNHDIRMQFKRTQSLAATSATAGEGRGAAGNAGSSSNNDHAKQPLITISGNALGKPTTTAIPGNKSQLQSLYQAQTSDAFCDGPDTGRDTLPSIVKADAPPKPLTTVRPAVPFDEDDFDDEYDLAYAPPIAVPVPSKTTTSTTHSTSQSAPLPTRKTPEVVNLVSTQALPWSSSPPSHLGPPPGRTTSTQPADAPTLKRQSSGELPVAKRRMYPETFNTRSYSTAQAVSKTPAASKSRDAYDLELTASIMQEQKRKLRDRTALNSNNSGSSSKVDDDVRELMRTTLSTTAKNAIALSTEQKHVLDLVVNKGKSVFFTGPAGTGKSVLMRAIIEELRSKYANQPERVAVTASTGFAACNIGGITLHSFAGIGLGKEDAPTLVRKVRRNQVAKQRWLKTKILIIDEVSMVDGELFDKLSQIGRQIRGNGRPWGGLQLVITGDFFQLPPVAEGGREAKFAFDAATWNTSIDHTIGLTQVFRQRDPVFANMLNEMRLGRIDAFTIDSFKKLERPLPADGGIEATELFSTRQEVEQANTRRLLALPGEPHHYISTDTGKNEIRDRLLQNMMAPKSLTLKVGAQVMLIKNLDENLVNGTQGTIVGFKAREDLMPEKVGEGGTPTGSMEKSKETMKTFNLEAKTNPKYPHVLFRLSNGRTQHLLCEPHDWKVELPNGDVQASRKQVPLILAWALSIHKAQGQTLERVRVNLHRVFEKGQAYVALSRATTQEGLQVLGFQPSKVMAHSRVIDFYQRLYSVEMVVNRKITDVITLADAAAAAAVAAAPTKGKQIAAVTAVSGRKPAVAQGLAVSSEDSSRRGTAATGGSSARDVKKEPAYA